MSTPPGYNMDPPLQISDTSSNDDHTRVDRDEQANLRHRLWLGNLKWDRPEGWIGIVLGLFSSPGSSQNTRVSGQIYIKENPFICPPMTLDERMDVEEWQETTLKTLYRGAAKP